MKNKFIYWAPRIISILFLLFLALFSLDIFEGNYGFWGTIIGLLMHNIPVFILAIILAISWRYEIVGGIGFILAGLLYLGLASSSLIIAGPAFLVGVLFLLNWQRRLAR